MAIYAGREGKVPLALESVLMNVLHAPVMQSLVTLHAQADAAIHKQAKMHCCAGSKVWTCHKDVTAYFIELKSRRRQDRPLPYHAKQSSTVCRTMQNFIMLPQKSQLRDSKRDCLGHVLHLSIGICGPFGMDVTMMMACRFWTAAWLD